MKSELIVDPEKRAKFDRGAERATESGYCQAEAELVCYRSGKDKYTDGKYQR